MALLDAKSSVDLFKLVVFIVVTTLATAVLVVTIGNINFNDTRTYRAVFSDVTGVVEGDDVRVAGVKVGTVEDIQIVDRTRAELTFEVDTGTPLYEGTRAAIRYRNLIGQRYLAISKGVGGTGRLPEGATLPLSQTTPALDLTVLFNGFKPLFQALSPDDVNRLSYEIIQVFQGEGGTMEGLLRHTASVTSTLADRDQIITQLIDNLTRVLDHVADRDQQLTRLIDSFRSLVGGLKRDRHAILGALDKVSTLSVETADLVDGIREPLVRDIKHLRKFAGNIDANKAELDRALQVLPIKLNKIGGTATYGSFFNFYLCEFKGRVVLPGGETVSAPYETGSERCDLG